MSFSVVILAAGKGTRMKSSLPKVLHPLSGVPLVAHVVETVSLLNPREIIVVVGFKAEMVKEALKDYGVKFVLQEEQLGTGDAVLRCEAALSSVRDVLVVCGDTPLLRKETLEKLLTCHRREKPVITILTAEFSDPSGYGRIVRGNNGEVRRIVEEKDASPEEAKIKEINSGTYVFAKEFLFSALKGLSPDNAQGEYYLTEVVEKAFEKGLKVAAVMAEDPEEVLGVNSQQDLARAERISQARIKKSWMARGVTFVNPETIYVEKEVRLSAGVRVYPCVVLRGRTEVKEGAEILSFSYLEEAIVGAGRKVGPGACLINEILD